MIDRVKEQESNAANVKQILQLSISYNTPLQLQTMRADASNSSTDVCRIGTLLLQLVTADGIRKREHQGMRHDNTPDRSNSNMNAARLASKLS